jgi:hypothetical protein
LAQRLRFWLWIVAAVAIGLLIAWVDSRPTWDDSGITAGAILLGTAFFAFVDPARAWLGAIAVGVWVPAIGIAMHRNYGSLLALGVALLGAALGVIGRKVARVLGAQQPPGPPAT